MEKEETIEERFNKASPEEKLKILAEIEWELAENEKKGANCSDAIRENYGKYDESLEKDLEDCWKKKEKNEKLLRELEEKEEQKPSPDSKNSHQANS